MPGHGQLMIFQMRSQKPRNSVPNLHLNKTLKSSKKYLIRLVNKILKSLQRRRKKNKGLRSKKKMNDKFAVDCSINILVIENKYIFIIIINTLSKFLT